MESKQRIVVGAEIIRSFYSTNRLAGYPAEGRTVERASVDAKADNLAAELIHDNESPVALKYRRLSAK